MKPTLIIVGLGNPGAAYEHTRHNAGFRALDALNGVFGGGPPSPRLPPPHRLRGTSRGAGEWKERAKLLSVVSEITIGEVPVLLVKPTTFMNRSGEAVAKLMNFYKADPSFQLLVLSDDCDLPLGEIRFRHQGGPGTHNGLKSVVEHVGEGFPRIRIGLGAAPAGTDLANWVLSVPQEEERQQMERALREELPNMVKEHVLGSAP
ncbi:MAG: aminoacyl-tRNA hydrolase [Candidatus Peribacteraceae bacterium]|nr:aminoacyl-tRNA hydrolase [Candidatus Peribacteraceae bacterium]